MQTGWWNCTPSAETYLGTLRTQAQLGTNQARAAATSSAHGALLRSVGEEQLNRLWPRWAGAAVGAAHGGVVARGAAALHGRLRGAGRQGAALDVKVTLTPPCIFH